MNAPFLRPLILPCWVNGYRSATGGTWHSDPLPSLEEAIARAAYVTGSGRSRLVYRWHCRARLALAAPPVILALPASAAEPDGPDLSAFGTLGHSSEAVDAVVAEILSEALAEPQAAEEPPAAAIPTPEPEPAPAPLPERSWGVRHQAPARNTIKTGSTQKDRILDAYAASADVLNVIATKLELTRALVKSTIAAGREVGDARVATGDRKRVDTMMPGSKKTATGRVYPPEVDAAAEALARAGQVKGGVNALPPGKVCLADETTSTVIGPLGTWHCAVRIARALAFMSDGQLYGPLVLARAGYPRSVNLEETLRGWRTKLAAIGIKLVEAPKIGFRLEIMETRP